MIEIRTYSDKDREEVIRLVLHCQNDGTRPSVSVDDQPELRRIPEKYMDGGGNFWVAKDNGNTDRAHKFYERAGFTKIERADVPVVYDFPYEDSDFFRLEI